MDLWLALYLYVSLVVCARSVGMLSGAFIGR